MTAKLEVTFTESAGRMNISISAAGVVTPAEAAHLIAVTQTVRMIVADIGESPRKCCCPSCKGKREVKHERENMH